MNAILAKKLVKMKVVEVTNRKLIKKFLKVPRLLYRNDRAWVCPLDIDIEGIFDREKNVYFQHGEAIRWILEDENGNLIGRIGAFINNKKAFSYEVPTGGVGFFECIENEKAAFLLFDTGKNWLIERGMKAMLGPINFGENDNFWGLLVEGFTHPSYGMNYNPPYYKKLFESYGFEKKLEQITNHLDLTKPLPDRFHRIAQWVLKKPQNNFVHYSKENTEKFISDFITIYNQAWAHHENFTPLEREYVRNNFKQLKPILEKRFIWFGYVNNEPAGFILAAPDVNQIVKELGGKLHFFNKIKFVLLKKLGKINRVRIFVMGIVPKYQNLGLEVALTYNAFSAGVDIKQYKEGELSWVGDFNEKMKAMHKEVGSVFGKKHITYGKNF